MRGILLSLSILLYSCNTLLAQGTDASAHLSADRDKMLVGDQARVTLQVQHDPKLSRISWPDIPDSVGKLEVVGREKIDTVQNGPLTVYRQTLKVSGFDSGVFSFSPLQVGVSPVSGTPYALQTDSILFLVQTVAVDTTKEFKPIKGIMAVKGSWLDYIWWMIGALLALLAIWMIVYFARQKKHAIPPPPPPPKPLHVKVFAALDALEKEQLWQKGQVKEYYVRLTDILRSYIEARFNIPAMERTTDELTGIARRNSELAPYAEKIYGVLFMADFAKFARAEPLLAEHLAAMQTTRDFVTSTIPAPAAPPTQPVQP